MSEKKVSLSNGEVRALLETRFRAATSAHHVVVLNRGPHDIFRADEMDPASAYDALSEHLLDPDPDYPELWLRSDPARSPASSTLLPRLVSDIPTHHVVWCPPVHCDERTVERLTTLPSATPGSVS
jgi:hypothetical protein